MVAGDRSRNTRRIQDMKKEFRRLRPQPCMRCGQAIDYEAEPGDPNSFSLGHIKDWKRYPELREDRGNIRQEHLRCNLSAKQDDGSNRQPGMRSGLLG